jgi:SAM-dependent methyltransferase
MKQSVDISKLRREFVRFRDRPDRPRFIGKRFHSYLNGKVVDIGCDQAVLRTMLGRENYLGVGMTTESDVKVNLDDGKPLPFGDASCDTVMCLDTLEHLDNFHEVCNELFRIAAKYVLISLPNCWCQARRSMAKGSGSIWQYGLPLSPPQDRHKWLFNTEEACAFLLAQESRKNVSEIVELVALENKRPLINRIWRRLKYPSRRKYLNLYPHTVVCVYQLGTGLKAVST